MPLRQRVRAGALRLAAAHLAAGPTDLLQEQLRARGEGCADARRAPAVLARYRAGAATCWRGTLLAKFWHRHDAGHQLLCQGGSRLLQVGFIICILFM
jgi:hypothetical protein